MWSPFNKSRLAVLCSKKFFVIDISKSNRGPKFISRRIQVEVGVPITDLCWINETSVAIASLDHIKLYDLSVDVLSPTKTVFTENGDSIKSLSYSGQGCHLYLIVENASSPN